MRSSGYMLMVVCAIAASDAGAEAPAADATKTESSSLREAVLRQASAAMPAQLGVVAVHLPAALADRQLAGATAALRWRNAPRPGMVVVELIVREPTGESQRGWIRLDVRPIRSVLVAARDLRSGERLAAGDLRFEARPVARGEGWHMSPAALTGARVLGDVALGAMIGGDQVEAPPPIARGTEVSVLVRRGRVAIATTGRLERSARPGEVTSVRIDNQRVLNGRLADATTVEVGVGE